MTLPNRRLVIAASASALILSSSAAVSDAQSAPKPGDAEVSVADSIDVGTPPSGIGDSDPLAVKEIISMELALQHVYNTSFLSNPSSPLAFYVSAPTTHFYDIFFPGEYQGAAVRAFFDRIGPSYVGTLKFADIKVMADSRVGFVYMKQHYSGKDLKGNPFLWVMRQTDGVVKIDGRWKIAHTHISFPVSEKTLVATTTGWPESVGV